MINTIGPFALVTGSESTCYLTVPPAAEVGDRLLTKHLDLMFKHLAVTFTTILAVSVLVAACANSNGAESTSPGVTQDVVTSEVAESAQVNDEGVFVRVVAPLDEARGYCLDIPGHMTSVRLESPLHVHTKVDPIIKTA